MAKIKLLHLSRGWRLVIMFIVLVSPLFVSPAPIFAAYNFNDYFSFSYNAQFSKQNITGSESFSVIISGKVDCIKEVPLMPIGQGTITGRIVAQRSGVKVTLNPSYQLNIANVPDRVGQSYTISPITVLLQFPSGSTAGTYAVIGEPISATISTALGTFPVESASLPSSQTLGTVSFSLPATPPTVSTSSASGVSDSAATLNGNLSAMGTASSVTVSFEYGTSTSYGSTVSGVPSSLTAAGTFTASLTGLSQGTTYHYRAKGDGGASGVSTGSDTTFTTTTPTPTPTPSTTPGANGGEGGGGAPKPPTNQTTLTSDVSSIVNSSGTFTKAFVAQSSDSTCTLTINEGTKALNDDGSPVLKLTMAPVTTTRPAPSSASTIGITYDFGPSGATFEPPIKITLAFDPKNVPQGIDARNLVIALWDTQTGTWVRLTSTVDLANNTITASVSHFTDFTILASTRPSAFTLSDLSIIPAEASINETVNINIKVTNTGDLSGSYSVTLKLDDAAVTTKEVTLSGGSQQQVTFSAVKSSPGRYIVSIGSLTGSFTVKASPSPSVTPPPKSQTPASQPASPAPVPSPVPSPTQAPVPQPASLPVNATLIIIVLVAYIVVGIAAQLVIIRRK